MHWHTADQFSRYLKNDKKIFENTWPARSLGLIMQKMYALQLN